MKNTPYYGAFLRALLVAVLTGVSTFLSTWSTTNDAKTIGIAAATAFLAPFIARFGGEGTYDTNRDTKISAGHAEMSPSDVGATPLAFGYGSGLAEVCRGVLGIR